MKNVLRNLAYFSIVMASLTVILSHIDRPAAASSSAAQQAGRVVANVDFVFLTDDGQSYSMGGSPTGWDAAHPFPQLPIPANQIAFYGGRAFVDVNGNGWALDNNNHYVNYGPPPGGATAVSPQTWSQIKGQYAPKTGGGQ